MRIVLDTNMLVSGLLSPAGPPGRTVDLMTAGHLVVLFDDRILAEYGEVLVRPRLRIEPAEAAAILDVIELEGLLTPAAPLAVELPDRHDLPFLEVAAAGAADTLVTVNERHYQSLRGAHDVQVLSPARFLARYTELHPQG